MAAGVVAGAGTAAAAGTGAGSTVESGAVAKAGAGTEGENNFFSNPAALIRTRLWRSLLAFDSVSLLKNMEVES